MSISKVFLDENEMPRAWYNILPDLPEQLSPPINPATKEPVNPKDLEGIFGKELVKQEISNERWISIPEEVLEIYRIWRPTPLIRARNLEKALKTPAKIYYKWEGVSPPGSHKPNTAVAQAYYLAKQGFKRAATETGAGQWGSSLAFGCAFFDLEATVYMVRASYKQKPYRRVLMQLYGATVYPSPSDRTDVGRKFLEENPEHPGSLGIAISEAIEDVVKHQDEARYSLGSVVNHVLLHQTIMGLEAIKQFASIDDYPDVITGCIGGGSSFSGTFFPFYHERFISKKAKKEVSFIAAEPSACPSITKGVYTYDHGDTAMLTPLLKMYTLGHDFVPPPIHAGGLRYHGMAPSLCLLADKGIVEARAYNQREVFDAASLFTKTEGIVLAPETTHGLKAAIDEAIECRKKNESKTILFVGSGHGHFDMQAYADYLESKLPAYEYPKEEIEKSINRLRELYPELVK